MPTWKIALDAAIAANAHRPESRYLQLATVHGEGRPAVRTVVFRKFFGFAGSLMFCADGRSEKIGELTTHPDVEACWYFPETRQQFRLAGPMILVGPSDPRSEYAEARDQLWASISNESRSTFAWPPPGQDCAPLEAFQVPVPSATDPLETFHLLILEPGQVESLDLRARPHRRLISRRSGSEWQDFPINP